jgi:hypothetical protein
VAGRTILNQKAEANSELKLKMGPVAGAFAVAVRDGLASEYAISGPRGEAKTQQGLIATLLHAQKHAEMGFPTPVRWMHVTDSFRSHVLKTHVSMNYPFWGGAWRLHDEGHLGVFMSAGRPLVALDMFGVEDQGATDRLKAECVGLIFEEAAPSRELGANGIDEQSWETGLTSRRIPSYSNPAILNMNPPDEDYWVVQRWKFGSQVAPFYGYHPEYNKIIQWDGKDIDVRRMWFRFPAGDNPHVSMEIRKRNELALSDDQIKQRLSYGEFGSVKLGASVAEDFDRATMVAKERIFPTGDAGPLFFGWDGWHHPYCVIGQELKGQVRVYAVFGFGNRSGGIYDLIAEQVKPWLAKYAPFCFAGATMRLHGFDPSMETGDQSNPDTNSVVAIESGIGGFVEPIPTKWPPRVAPLMSLLKRRNALLIDPIDADPLVKALGGRWYYPMDRFGKVSRDLPKKPNHPAEDIGDAFLALLHRIAPGATKFDSKPPRTVSGFDPRYVNDPRVSQENFDPRI